MRIEGRDRRGNPFVVEDPNADNVTRAYRHYGDHGPGFAERNLDRAVRAGSWIGRNYDWVLGAAAGGLIAYCLNENTQLYPYAPIPVTALGATIGAIGGRYLRNHFTQEHD